METFPGAKTWGFRDGARAIVSDSVVQLANAGMSREGDALVVLGTNVCRNRFGELNELKARPLYSRKKYESRILPCRFLYSFVTHDCVVFITLISSWLLYRLAVVVSN